MIDMLKEYIALNTAHPEPDYASVVQLFKKYVAQDGFDFNECILPSGNPVVVITLPGSSQELPALALNHHMDVVPAGDESLWTYAPFLATVHEGIVYGRGTQDCKGLGIVHYAALKRIKESGLNLQRTIHMIVVPDEERGGFYGTKEFIAHPFFQSLKIGYVLDEGLPSGSHKELLLKIDERTPIQIRVTSVGVQSHASGLFHENCVHALINFLSDVTAFHKNQQKQADGKQAGNFISLHITSLTTHNDALNVIPSHAYATIDMRIPPQLSLDEGRAVLDALVKEHPTIAYEVLATSQERVQAVSVRSCFYQKLAQAVTDCGLIAQPFVFEATTDARFYSSKGIETIGVTPFVRKPHLHGIDESIFVDDLVQGTNIIYEFLHNFCIVVH